MAIYAKFDWFKAEIKEFIMLQERTKCKMKIIQNWKLLQYCYWILGTHYDKNEYKSSINIDFMLYLLQMHELSVLTPKLV